MARALTFRGLTRARTKTGIPTLVAFGLALGLAACGPMTRYSGAYAPGTYTLRLVVVDQTGNYPPPCRVIITVQR